MLTFSQQMSRSTALMLTQHNTDAPRLRRKGGMRSDDRISKMRAGSPGTASLACMATFDLRTWQGPLPDTAACPCSDSSDPIASCFQNVASEPADENVLALP